MIEVTITQDTRFPRISVMLYHLFPTQDFMPLMTSRNEIRPAVTTTIAHPHDSSHVA